MGKLRDLSASRKVAVLVQATSLLIAGSAILRNLALSTTVSGWFAASSAASEQHGDRGAANEEGTIFAAGYQENTDSLSFGDGITVAGSSDDKNALLVSYDASGTALSARTTEAGPDESIFRGVATSGGNAFAVGQQLDNHTYSYGDGLEVSGSASGTYFGTPNTNAVIVRF